MTLTACRQVLAVRAAGVLALAFFLPALVDRAAELIGGLVLVSLQGNATAWQILERHFHWFSARWFVERARVFTPWLVLGAAGAWTLRLNAPRLMAIIRRSARGGQA